MCCVRVLVLALMLACCCTQNSCSSVHMWDCYSSFASTFCTQSLPTAVVRDIQLLRRLATEICRLICWSCKHCLMLLPLLAAAAAACAPPRLLAPPPG